MTKNNEPTDKPAETSPVEAKTPEAPEGVAAPRTRKIVRRSASTLERPTFNATEESKPAEGAPAPAGDAASAAPPSGDAAPAPRVRATFDARAPRPVRPAGEQRPQRPQGDRPGRPQRGGGGGDYRPPPARPVGARPIPGGSRAPAPEGSFEGARGRDGDYRAPPARPLGARPIPGGPRAPAPDRPHDDRPRDDRPRNDRPRDDRPRNDRPRDDRRPPRPEGAPAPRLEGAPAPRPAAPVPARAVPQPPHASKPQPAKVATPKARPIPILLNVPPPRAGSAAAKPALTAKEALSARAKAATPSKSEAPKTKPAEAAGPSTFDAALIGVGQDGAKEALRSVGDKAAALVEAWLVANNAAAVVAVAEAGDVASVARKAARRALNVLRARGIAIPEQAHVVRMDDRAEVSLEATYLPPDPSGTSSV
ncbi:MAG: hypothetical protein ABI193_14920, partial [Minicystis sp.]